MLTCQHLVVYALKRGELHAVVDALPPPMAGVGGGSADSSVKRNARERVSQEEEEEVSALRVVGL